MYDSIQYVHGGESRALVAVGYEIYILLLGEFWVLGGYPTFMSYIVLEILEHSLREMFFRFREAFYAWEALCTSFYYVFEAPRTVFHEYRGGVAIAASKAASSLR